jgi:hypothetical protein
MAGCPGTFPELSARRASCEYLLAKEVLSPSASIGNVCHLLADSFCRWELNSASRDGGRVRPLVPASGRASENVPVSYPRGADAASVQTTKRPIGRAFSKPSDGLEPSTPSLPSRTRAIIRNTVSPANRADIDGGDASRGVARVVSDVSVLCPPRVARMSNIVRATAGTRRSCVAARQLAGPGGSS